jgi:modulator of FtsH protease HflK
MDQNIKRSGLINFLALLLIGVATFAIARYTNSLAGQIGTIFLGVGMLVAAVSWFQMRLEDRERLEKLEFDEMAKARAGSGLFETKDAELFPAQRSREQFEKFFLPIFTILLFIAQSFAAFILWRWLEKLNPGLRKESALMALGFFAIFFLIFFLLGKYSAGISRLEKQRLLRPSAAYLLLGAYLCFLVAAGIVGVAAGFPKADLWLARGFCVLLALTAVETLISLILEIYRPRVKGKEVRPLYESRLVGLLGQPEGLVTTAAQAIDYQFGFKVSETWFYKTLAEKLPLLILALAAVMVLSSCILFVEPGEQALIERFGRPIATQRVLGPGPHLKMPWPMDKVYRFPVREVQTFNIGFIPDPAREKDRTILWTVAHYKEEFNLLVASRDEQILKRTNEPMTEKAVPVNLLVAGIPVQFHITNILAWAYNHEDPTNLLQQLATREVVRYLAGVDLIEIMSEGREQAAAELLKRVQNGANDMNLGVEILFVGMQDIHPPTKVAPDFQAVIGARQEIAAKVLKAQADAARTVPGAQAEAQRKVREAESDASRRIIASAATAARFTNQITAYNAAPQIYLKRLYLQTLAQSSVGARKYVFGATNITEVEQIDLEDKLASVYERVSVPPPEKR